MLRGLIAFLISLLLWSCYSDPGFEIDPASSASPEPGEITTQRNYYLYISHTRTATNNSLISTVYDLDLSPYEMRLLGGDLALDTSAPSILSEVDALFDLRSPTTLWSLGNHDEMSDADFFYATGRNKFYATSRNNTTFIVLNSQDSLSSIVNEQKDFFYNVMDTVQTTNILVLSHKLIFMLDHPSLDSRINDICNGKKGNCFPCHNPNNFRKDVLPKICEARDRGQNVYWIGGDLGAKETRFAYRENGILFLGNGMSHMRNDNEVLLLMNTERSIKYRFLPIDTVIKYQGHDNFPERFLQ